jgi:hypothetical protein
MIYCHGSLSLIVIDQMRMKLYVNGNAMINLWSGIELVLSIREDVSNLYTSATDTHLLIAVLYLHSYFTCYFI